ncbi:MAG: hypothetical protein H8K03_05795 [Nitrospira sp.]
MPQLLTVLIVVSVVGMLSGWSTGFAQVDSTTPSVQPQTPAVISQLQPLVAPTSGVSAKLITPSTNNRSATSELRSSSNVVRGRSGGVASGMRDPTTPFMRPPTVGPLFCDPVIDIPC